MEIAKIIPYENECGKQHISSSAVGNTYIINKYLLKLIKKRPKILLCTTFIRPLLPHYLERLVTRPKVKFCTDNMVEILVEAVIFYSLNISNRKVNISRIRHEINRKYKLAKEIGVLFEKQLSTDDKKTLDFIAKIPSYQFISRKIKPITIRFSNESLDEKYCFSAAWLKKKSNFFRQNG